MNPPHEPTDETREMVKSLSGFGVPQEDICVVLDISQPTLRKYYRREIDLGFAQANAKVGESLFKQATSGNTSAAIFWMKARAGWRETQTHELMGKDGGAIKMEEVSENAAAFMRSIASIATREGKEKKLESIDDETKEHLQKEWNFWARPNQKPPAGTWQYWLILAGRGFGKTRVGAETVREWAKTHTYVNLIGATVDDARDIMIEGESGILEICRPDERPLYKKSERKLIWPNGGISLIFTADEPERLRGKQHGKLWADELCAWRYPESWDQAMFGLRLGDNPQAVVTTTPKPSPLLKELINNPHCHVTRGSTYDNKANLAPSFFDKIVSKYEGTRLGRQELDAEVLDDVPGALWSEASIDNNRVMSGDIPDMLRVVIGVDPSGADDSSDLADEIGIVVAGLGDNGEAYVLEDLTVSGGPDKWSKVIASAYERHMADKVVAEINFGGAMVESVIRAENADIAFKSVTASRGKHVRAEPIAALYEKGKVRHVGVFARLEEQMRWFTTTGYKGDGSPDRVDALVWALSELFPSMTKKQKKKIDANKGLVNQSNAAGSWMVA